jgi:hypothetical protein
MRPLEEQRQPPLNNRLAPLDSRLAPLDGAGHREKKAQHAPDRRRGQEDLVMRAREPALLRGHADVVHVREQPLLDADLEERGEARRHELYCG